MIKRSVIIAIALVLLASPLMAGETEKVSWKKGYTWTYKMVAGNQTTLVTSEVVDLRKIWDAPRHRCWIVRSTFSIDGGEVAMTTCYDAEEQQENETSMGIYKQKIRYKQDIFWSHVLDMVTGEELIKMDIVYAPKPGEQLLPIGDRNYGTDISTHLGLGGMEGMRRKANMFTAFVIQNIGRETIKVPAGTFDTYHVRITSVMEDTTMDFEAQPMLLMGPSTHIYGQTVTKDVWFSYDVRNIVRMESVSQETEEQMGEMLEQETTTVMELVSYSL